MTVLYFNLNEKAFTEVEKALEENHKLMDKLGFIPTETVNAYLENAQRTLSENACLDGASFEITSLESNTGNPIVINLSNDCINIEEIEEDE